MLQTINIESFMLEVKKVNFEDIKSILISRGIEYTEGVAYIMPEAESDDGDIINEYSPDLRKDFKESSISSVVVRGENHSYLGLRCADIILPLIIGIPFAIFANFMTDWIKNNINDNKKVRMRYIREKNGEHEEILIEGTGDEVIEIIDKLKKD